MSLRTEASIETLSAEGTRNANVDGPRVSILTVVRNRANELSATIASVRAQTHRNIEYIIVDGASTDDTIEIVKANKDVVDLWISEPDHGIYDAINKAIGLASGDYVAILHAGDRYAPNFVADAVACAEGNPGAIAYCGHLHGKTPVAVSDADPGVFLHYLGLNISACLVPRGVYSTIGGYDINYRIISDHIWIRDAMAKGVTFTRFKGHHLTFAEGGVSTAKNKAQVDLIIGENIAALRRVFSFLSDTICEAIYLYRFNEAKAGAILDYVTDVAREGVHPGYALFLDSLASMLAYLWPQRELQAAKASPNAPFAATRLKLAERLQIPLEATNITFGSSPILQLRAQLDAIAAATSGQRVVLHYLEVFSRRSESFIYDLLKELSTRGDEAHVVLCDKRLLQAERHYDNVFAFDYEAFDETAARMMLANCLATVAPTRFVFHFAINGWRLMSRADRKYQELPALYMTHGIDVFELARDTPYSAFILNTAVNLPRTSFSAVSQYLREALIGFGVPASKTVLIHNSAHERFFAKHVPGRDKVASRKASGWQIRIINVGRMVKWKGHATLIRAIAVLRDVHCIDAHLTIVYGEEAREKSTLERLLAELQLTDRVMLRAAVDFAQEPLFYAGFDLLISASTYSEGDGRRSETFGMSILEGIAAGLPVVVTDAGAQAEVTGPECRFARIVPHDDPDAMARAVHELFASGALDDDNHEYARTRLAEFSTDRRMSMLDEFLSGSDDHALRIAVFSTGVAHGAGAAALRVHKSLLLGRLQSRLFTRADAGNIGAEPQVFPLKCVTVGNSDYIHPAGNFLRAGHTIFSIDTNGLADELIAEIAEASDVISLHWHARFLSLKNVAALTRSGKPVVITIRDMQPLTGGCHFFHGCDNWRHACLPCPQFLPENVHLPHATFQEKLNRWSTSNLTIVVLSEHTRNIVSQSRIFGGCRIEKIMNPIDTETFRPVPRAEAREALHVPHDKRVIAFLPSYGSRIKGAREAEAALALLARSISPDSCVLICAGAADNAIASPFRTMNLGFISDNGKLAQLYAAADVTLVASLEETFSNTAAESIACGTPVAGFSTGAIAELASDGRGINVPVGDVHRLSEALAILLDHDVDRQALHDFIATNMSMDQVGKAYRALFEDLVRLSSGAASSPPEVTLRPLDDLDFEKFTLAYMSSRLRAAIPKSQQMPQSRANPTPVFKALRRIGRYLFRGDVPEWGKALGNRYLSIESQVRPRRRRS